jgi:uncharacterized membrane protein YqjE
MIGLGWNEAEWATLIIFSVLALAGVGVLSILALVVWMVWP